MVASVSPQQSHVSRHKGNTYTGRIRKVRGWGCEGGDENGSGWEDVRVCKGTLVPADPVNPLMNSLLLSQSAMYSLCGRKTNSLYMIGGQ